MHKHWHLKIGQHNEALVLPLLFWRGWYYERAMIDDNVKQCNLFPSHWAGLPPGMTGCFYLILYVHNRIVHTNHMLCHSQILQHFTMLFSFLCPAQCKWELNTFVHFYISVEMLPKTLHNKVSCYVIMDLIVTLPFLYAIPLCQYSRSQLFSV